jgi:hypothetical protein
LLTTTVVAFVAVTVRVDDAPAETDVGLALMVTVGAGLVPPPLLPPPPPPQALIPIRKIREKRTVIKEEGREIVEGIVLRGGRLVYLF